ncbi:transaldolase family protein [Georgenia satyanarayanai]|uniref:transaldolase family protein n=1 Tax=Georgenia satyanarayanai TaxID=860221 RepID=UPI00186B56DD|nr:transaldolase family protein [Georgenia satyanarayanai]
MHAPKLFVDSADQRATEDLFATGAFMGLTTNPTILERGGAVTADLPRINRWARAAGAREVCLQTWGETREELLANASHLLDVDARTIVKVPCTVVGVPAAATLVGQGVEVLLTAVYRPSQMVVACSIGARYVAPYVGRMADSGADALADVVAMHEIAAGGRTEVLAASLRTADDAARLAAAGIPAFTLSPSVAWELVRDERSDAATEVFEATMARLGRV